MMTLEYEIWERKEWNESYLGFLKALDLRLVELAFTKVMLLLGFLFEAILFSGLGL